MYRIFYSENSMLYECKFVTKVQLFNEILTNTAELLSIFNKAALIFPNIVIVTTQYLAV